MQLGNMSVQNFMSIEDAQINFSSQGLVLIQGVNDDSDAFESNGAGKSTLFSEAPTWIIYGETIRGQKGDKVVNRNVGKNTVGSLEIIDDNGEVYTIVRHRKHSKFKNQVQLFKGDTNITAKSDKDTDQMIVDLLEMDFLTFTNSVMFGQGVTKMFASSTDKEQKSILEKMLQIDIYKRCQELATEKLKNINKQVTDLKTEQVTLLTLKEAKETTLDELQKSEAELESKCSKAIEELEERRTQLLESLAKLEKSNVKELELELGDLEGLIAKVDLRIEGLAPIRRMSTDHKSHELSFAREISKLKKELASSIQKLDDVKGGKNVPKTCSACGQDLPSNDTSHLEKHLEDSIEELQNSIAEQQDKLVEVTESIKELDTRLDVLPKLEQQRRLLQDECSIIKQDIKSVADNINKVNRDIEAVDKDIKKQEELRASTFTGAIESAIESIEEYKVSLAEVQDNLGTLLDSSEDYDFWVNAYGNSGIKSILLDSVVPFLDARANEYLSVMTDSSIEVKFHTQQLVKTTGEYKDKFNVEIINKNGDDDYKSNSGGEKRRIDIGINMALQDLVMSRSSKSLDIILYDEVFESLDELGSHKVIELLEKKSKEVGTIYVVTHNDSLKQLFSQSVTVLKSNGRTVLEYGS